MIESRSGKAYQFWYLTQVRVNKPADSLPITKVTFSFSSIALFKLDFACLRKAPREFLGMAIVGINVPFCEGFREGKN